MQGVVGLRARVPRAKRSGAPFYGVVDHDVYAWSPDEVEAWLHVSGREELCDVFAGFDGDALMAMDGETLTEFGLEFSAVSQLLDDIAGFERAVAGDQQHQQQQPAGGSGVSAAADVAAEPPHLRLAHEFLHRVTPNWRQLPYGLCFVYKVLRDAVSACFPKSPGAAVDAVVSQAVCMYYFQPLLSEPEKYGVMSHDLIEKMTARQKQVFRDTADLLYRAACGRTEVPASTDPASEELARAERRFLTQAVPRFRDFTRHLCQARHPLACIILCLSSTSPPTRHLRAHRAGVVSPPIAPCSSAPLAACPHCIASHRCTFSLPMVIYHLYWLPAACCPYAET